MPLSTSFRSRTFGSITCCRLNIKSCRVRSAARCPALWISSISAAHRLARLQLAQHHLPVAQDDGQDVVEVVGNASREHPDRVHLLRMSQLALGLLQSLLGSLALRQIRVLAMHESALRVGKGQNGIVGIVPLRGELLVRIVPARLLRGLMGLLLLPLRVDDRVGSLTFPIENGVGDVPFGLLAIVGHAALPGDRAVRRRCLEPFAREDTVGALAELEELLILHDSIAVRVEAIVQGVLRRPLDGSIRTGAFGAEAGVRVCATLLDLLSSSLHVQPPLVANRGREPHDVGDDRQGPSSA